MAGAYVPGEPTQPVSADAGTFDDEPVTYDSEYFIAEGGIRASYTPKQRGDSDAVGDGDGDGDDADGAAGAAVRHVGGDYDGGRGGDDDQHESVSQYASSPELAAAAAAGGRR
eukprot:CAMPEP_0203822760 /NCGR_PEP_ID=MMETSP0115-20131106/47184_1 /ASSEMBLY_ACC=CAM_ASM_000227 /TAXON_ID=33651 /ORGANISM="Bicosoecid sp, Strain ms1" /LENGTH=112 /DNA_ID=CAMNT_0050731795 /DNA_START=121 /DNA_END=456 /DNA_ORIENTATION=+